MSENTKLSIKMFITVIGFFIFACVIVGVFTGAL